MNMDRVKLIEHCSAERNRHFYKYTEMQENIYEFVEMNITNLKNLLVAWLGSTHSEDLGKIGNFYERNLPAVLRYVLLMLENVFDN